MAGQVGLADPGRVTWSHWLHFLAECSILKVRVPKTESFSSELLFWYNPRHGYPSSEVEASCEIVGQQDVPNASV